MLIKPSLDTNPEMQDILAASLVRTELINALTDLGVVGSLLAALAGYVFGVLGHRGRGGQLAQPSGPVDPTTPINWEVDTRLVEARSVLRRQERVMAWDTRSMNALTFSQYIIGGVLASSFVQTQLSKETIGLLGVLVLVSSLIHQKYRPDTKRRNSAQRVAQLRALIRWGEDAIFKAHRNGEDSSAVFPVRQRITEGIGQVEAAELSELTSFSPELEAPRKYQNRSGAAGSGADDDSQATLSRERESRLKT